MIAAVLDHLVIAARTLQEGLDYCASVLGVRPPPGGQHARMGTHNHLMQLGGGVYLEVIAVDPCGARPEQPRWFALDSDSMQTRLAAGPALITFVARTPAITGAVAALPELGTVQPMQRGSLHWDITIRDDGMLSENGTLPPLIAWPPGINPATAMADLGCRLLRVDVHHPEPEALTQKWRRVGLDRDPLLSIVAAAPGTMPYLAAHIDTPDGRRILSGKIPVGAGR